jgi:hypothetical protein
MQVPELTDDAVVELAREGGVAFIPKLSGQRTIALSSLNEAQRQRLVSILEQAFPRGQPPGKPRHPAAATSAISASRLSGPGKIRRTTPISSCWCRSRKRPSRWSSCGRKAKAACAINLRPEQTPRVFRDKTVAVLAEIVHRPAGF